MKVSFYRVIIKCKENVAALLSFAREKGIEVVHIQAEYSEEKSPWIDYTKITSPSKNHCVQSNFCEFSKPAPQEKVCVALIFMGKKVFVKNYFDCFIGTEVEDYLKKSDKKHLIVAGLVTNCCILFSVTGAFFRGFRPIVMYDCCADRLQERHDFVFNTYSYMFRKASLETLNSVLEMQ